MKFAGLKLGFNKIEIQKKRIQRQVLFGFGVGHFEWFRSPSQCDQVTIAHFSFFKEITLIFY
jgi:hypothetical protein